VGELLIEGPTVSRGYLNDPGRTADVFISSPTWLKKTRASSRLYKTGDLVRYNENGEIIFCGRKDAQVKVHGQRLELSEIEHQLACQSLIQDAAVVLPKAGLCKGRLVAVISFAQDVAVKSRDELQLVNRRSLEESAPQVSTFRTYLESRLPSYMVPQIWVIVKSVPLSPCKYAPNGILIFANQTC